VASQRGLDGVRADVRVAVHVSTDPRTHPNQRRVIRKPGGQPELRFQRLLEHLEEHRHRAVEHPADVVEHVLPLVFDGGPLMGVLFGLPGRGEIGLDTSPRHALLPGRTLRVQPIEQALGDALLLVQDRASRGFGGVGREYRLDPKVAEQPHDLVLVQSGRPQRPNRRSERAALRLVITPQIGSSSPDAVDLLGQVYRLEVGGERAHEFGRPARLHGVRLCPDPVQRASRMLPPADGLLPHPLDALVEIRSALFADHPAHQGPEAPDVLPQRLVLGAEGSGPDIGGGHGYHENPSCVRPPIRSLVWRSARASKPLRTAVGAPLADRDHGAMDRDQTAPETAKRDR
jgi:hypothetical protein